MAVTLRAFEVSGHRIELYVLIIPPFFPIMILLRPPYSTPTLYGPFGHVNAYSLIPTYLNTRAFDSWLGLYSRLSVGCCGQRKANGTKMANFFQMGFASDQL